MKIESEIELVENDEQSSESSDLLHKQHHHFNLSKQNPKSLVGSESHQYEQTESEVWWHHQLQRYVHI